MERGFVVVVCRACENPPCGKVCPTGALKKRDAGGVKLDEGKCFGCGYCRQACPIGCAFWSDEVNKPMICIHCGFCARFCPHRVLGLEKGREADHVYR